MTDRNIKKKLAKSVVICMASPVIINLVGGGGIQANAMVGARVSRTGSISSRASSLSSSSSLGKVNSLRVGNTGVNSTAKYKLSKTEKTLGAISIVVGGVSVLGTITGLALTDNQLIQNKKIYEDVIDRTYNSFYEEREKYMSDLFAQWGVQMPDKYKNPLNTDKEEKATPGFSFGKEE